MRRDKSILQDFLNKGAVKESDFIGFAEIRRDESKWKRYAQKVAFHVLAELKRKGMSQIDLAQRVGVSKQQVNKWVKGKQNFTLETLGKLESALGIQLIHFYADQSAIAQKEDGFSFNQTSTYTVTSDIRIVRLEKACRTEFVKIPKHSHRGSLNSFKGATTRTQKPSKSPCYA